MKSVVILATSESPGSRSQVMARFVEKVLKERGNSVTLFDVRDSPTREDIHQALMDATHVVFAVPIYNFGTNAVAKRWVEEIGGALEGKVAGFLCQAGGPRGYMSVLSLANSLMLDFRCWIVPRFVYATGSDYVESDTPDPALTERLELFATELLSK